MSEKVEKAKQKWTVEDDAKLDELIKLHGSHFWPKIGSMMPGRTARQCRERWHHKLNPEIKKGAWTPDEDRILLENQKVLGNRNYSSIILLLSWVIYKISLPIL